ncbi:phytanoyl-CoA dioxygenase family protein [Saccharothrix sp. Mg75]|uniref:phytanoyl-CoA dioxygenase family protein n=1 Tax=Saccharothrix sp. Mg75 TaxID=3445357 RepID=UPI003EE9F54E
MSVGLPIIASVASVDIATCVAALRKYGVVIVERWATGRKLEQLIDEHNQVFAAKIDTTRELNNYRPGTGSRAARLVTDQIAAILPETFTFLTDTTLRGIAGSYLGRTATINHAAYLTLDVAHSTPVTELHYDRKHALKAFLCLTPACRAYGAPEFVPGSHRHSKMIREAHLGAGIPESDLPIEFGHDGRVAISMNSPAGSLAIFDTDCLHSGGRVLPGKLRRVLRGHSHSTDVKAALSSGKD